MQASELYCKYLDGLCLCMDMSQSPAGTASFISFSFSQSEGHRLAGQDDNSQQVEILTFISQTQAMQGL